MWAEPAGDHPTWVFLDGELYLERVRAQDLVEEARDEHRLPQARCVFVSHGGPSARHDDFTCRPEYTTFLRDAILPHLGVEVGRAPPLLVGLTSALAAAFAVRSCAAGRPFPARSSVAVRVVAGRLRRHVERGAPGAGRYYFRVGTEETETGVRHAPTDMYQGVSQLDSVRRLADALDCRGNEVRLRTFAGGHDPRGWADELVDALAWADRVRVRFPPPRAQ